MNTSASPYRHASSGMVSPAAPWPIVIVLLALCVPVTAQVTTASFYGTVTDPSGAVIAGA